MASTEPQCAVTMVAQFVVGVGMHEHIERAVVEGKPTDDVGELRRRKRDLVTPSRMGTDRALMKVAYLYGTAQ
jgi:hypothetical protein